MTTAVLAPPDTGVGLDDLALLKVLRASLGGEWKTNVMNAAGCVLRDAFAAVGFGFKKCFDYAPLLHERQVACLWILELNDDYALEDAAAAVAGTDDTPREVPNMAVRVKIVVREVQTQVPDCPPETQLLCSLAMLVPSFELPADPMLREAWLERELLGVTIPMANREPADVAEHAREKLLAAVQGEQRARLKAEAEQLAGYVLRGLAP